MIVMKFGGTSLQDANAMRRVLSIVRSRLPKCPLVVVSAMSGVTDALIHCAETSHLGREHAALEKFEREVVSPHQRLMQELIQEPLQREHLVKTIEENFQEVRMLFHGLAILGELTPRSLDAIASYGERFSSMILAAFLQEQGIHTRWVDACGFLMTDDQYTKANPLMDLSLTKMREVIVPVLQQHELVITQGFIGSNRIGQATTLGRGGSDFSATIMGALLGAEEIEIWTDVPGVMTADPRVVPEARTISELSYTEAAELSYFGAKVLHPKTIWPAVDKKIPIRILDTFHPENSGTRILENQGSKDHPVKAVTSIRNLSILTVEGRGMLGVPGVAARAFTAVAKEGVNLLMITQSSSEQNICFVIEQQSAIPTIRSLEDAFEIEIARHQIDTIRAQDRVTIIAVVGAGMKGTPGIAAKVFGALSQSRINVISIAQGSSEYNLSFVVQENDADEAVRRIHHEFQL
jgi:bifunctional aspartokinase / homoserine dehydrogenase 1